MDGNAIKKDVFCKFMASFADHFILNILIKARLISNGEVSLSSQEIEFHNKIREFFSN